MFSFPDIISSAAEQARVKPSLLSSREAYDAPNLAESTSLLTSG